MITLLTDFGTADYFVGAMKGAILSVDEDARIVDITHEIPAYDIAAGAFTLLVSYANFPRKTIHVAVVDPGVGTRRRPILIASENYYFIGPDNGLLSYVCEREANCRVFHLNKESYFRHPVSPTFHGRDLFGPIAGTLSKGIQPDLLGSEITDFIRLAPLSARPSGSDKVDARIIHIDNFGNCITNLTRDDLTDEMIASGVTLRVAYHEIRSFRQFFGETNPTAEDVFCVWGSTGYLEIVAFRASAASTLDAERGQRVMLTRH